MPTLNSRNKSDKEVCELMRLKPNFLELDFKGKNTTEEKFNYLLSKYKETIVQNTCSKVAENELKEYNPELLDKDFIISVSKSDLLDDELKREISAEFPENRQPLFFSGVTGEGLQELKDAIWKKLHG